VTGWCSSPECFRPVNEGRLFIIVDGAAIEIDVCSVCKMALLRDKERARTLAIQLRESKRMGVSL
jgi:hypothetical protein